ncbi:WD40 repeat domain-containing protein [Vibrio sp. SM6]|uniref:WD40 repeat domain-containing protein n=2 Tax=Vibrio agarilyticus TaxID=2726741 RepID=A0A7X8TPP9_9VIBR|nr:WD40 repeat domain-containing protein [Vibrio agarilyticus]
MASVNNTHEVTASQFHQDTRFVDGARWAFVTDAKSKQLSVIDTFDHKQVQTIELQAIPSLIAVSDIQDLIVYSDERHSVLYIYDLRKSTHHQMPLAAIPQQLVFHSDGAQLAVGSQDRIDLIMPLTQTYIDTITELKSPLSINFDNGGYNLYLNEMATGKAIIYRLHDKFKRTLQLGTGPVSEITLSPDARLAMVAQYRNNQVIVHDLYAKQTLPAVQLSSAPLRPYVSSDSQRIIVSSHDGESVVLDAWDGKTIKSLSIGATPASIRSGWIETLGIIDGTRNQNHGQLSVFSLDEQPKLNEVSIERPLIETVVVSDSKTLFATQQGSTSLYLYDIRNQQVLAPIDTKLIEPRFLVMGITNTVCH